MIDYDGFSHCHLTDIFFAIFAGAKELKVVKLQEAHAWSELGVTVDVRCNWSSSAFSVLALAVSDNNEVSYFIYTSVWLLADFDQVMGLEVGVSVGGRMERLYGGN